MWSSVAVIGGALSGDAVMFLELALHAVDDLLLHLAEGGVAEAVLEFELVA